MAVSKRGQGSLAFSTKTVKARRTLKKDKKVFADTTNEKEASLKGVTKTHNWHLYSLVTASVVICYWKTFFGELVHDDIFAIKQNPDVLPSSSILDLFSHDYWGKPLESSLSHKSFRPLSVLTFRVHYFFHGFDPFGYRLVNILLHVATCLVFIHVCQRVLACSWLFSFFSGLLFAVHPIHTEAVNSIVGRADILACLLFLLAFITYINCPTIRSPTKKKVDPHGNKMENFPLSIRYGALALSLYKLLKPCWKSLVIFNILGAAALFAKENGITVFGFCILYDVMAAHECHLIRSKKQSSKIYNSLLVRIVIITFAASLLLYFRIFLQNGELPQFTADENPAAYSDSWLTRFLTYSYLCYFNAALLLVPYTLSYDWQMGSIPLVESLMDIRNVMTIAFFLVLLALFVISSATSILTDSGERKVFITGLLLLIIPFLPASNILFTVGFVVAERILYIPSLGYCLLINFGFAKLAGSTICKSKMDNNNICTTATKRCKITAMAYGIMLICLSMKTWQQCSVWQDRGTLFKSGVDAVPQNAKAHYNYANYLKDVERKREAIHHYQMAVELCPEHASAHNNLGTLLVDAEESMKHFKLAIKNDPYNCNAFLNLGIALSGISRLNESEKYLQESFRLNPNSTKTLMVLADVMTQNGRFEEAKQVYKDRILSAQDDTLVLLNTYGLFLTKNGKFDEALVYFNQAHSLLPQHGAPVINKANIFMAMGKYKDAENTLKKFLKKRRDASVLHHLASLYSKVLKRYSEAEMNWQEALKISPTLTSALLSYVEFLKSQSRGNEALDVITHFSKYHPKSIEVMNERVKLLYKMGHLEEALENLENVLAMSEDPLAYYVKGNILKDLGLYQKAITAYTNVLNIDPNLPEVYVNLGAAHHVLGNMDEAEMYYNQCLALDPDNRAARINLEKLKISSKES